MPFVPIFITPAHLPIENIGEFYNGLLHPLMVPSHVLAIITAGLLAGQKPNAALAVSRSFMVAIFTGLLLSGLGVRIPAQVPLVVGTMIASLVVAMKWGRIPQLVFFTLSVFLGVFIGLESTFEDENVKALIWCLLGCCVSASFASFYVALLTKKAKHPWQHIAVRIVASWIFAICLLLFSLQLAGA